MPTFAHRSISRDGSTVAGTITASTPEEAAERLIQDGMSPIEVAERGLPVWSRINVPVGQLRRPGARDVVAFTRDLARLTKAGLPLDRALALTIVSVQNSQFHHIIGDVRKLVRKGRPLAAALGRFPAVFSPMYVATVRSGEISGQLPATLLHLEGLLDRQIQFRSRVRSALIYPSLLLIAVLATLLLVVIVVLPQFAPLFDDAEHSVSLVTRMVLNVGAWLRFIGPWMLVLFPLGVLAATYALRDPTIRRNVGRRLAGLWLFSRPDVIASVRTLGATLAGGVPMDSAIALAASTATNPAMRDDLSDIAAQVKRGQPLSAELGKAAWLPPMVLQMARLGEETGRIHETLVEAAHILEQDYQARLERFLQLLGPLLTLVMGGMVAVLVGGVLLGMMSISRSML